MNPLDIFTDKKEEKNQNTSRELTVFKDPFKKASIVSISMRYDRFWSSDPFAWEGVVKFENGLTTGTQKTPKCATWEEFMVHMKQIYDSLENKPK